MSSGAASISSSTTPATGGSSSATASTGSAGKGHRLSVQSGTSLACVLREAIEAGLAGLEFLAGIPGTVGGAVYGNAGAYGWSIGDVLETASLFSPSGGLTNGLQGGIGLRLPGFGPEKGRRHRPLGHAPVLSGGQAGIGGRVRGILEKRWAKHPPHGTACAGSYFKNCSSASGARVAAGQLLDQAGARGLSVGDAAVSDVHCNFIINKGNARASDVLALAAELKDRVYQMFGVRLEEEVIYLRADASMP